MNTTAATMDFFEHQDTARRHTSVLIGYYVAAVILIMLAVYLVFAGLFIGAEAAQSETGQPDYSKLWNLELFASVMGGTIILVALGSIYKISQLAKGGQAVAEMLGGRLVTNDTRDIDERKLINVVEEMAIASGTPVPPVYIMDQESGINAFAAGFSPNDAVVAVTRGCISQLDRDELQGVIAHEFSHILNGDMRINIRLMGVLHGILVIALTGYWVMRVSAHSGGGNRKGGGGAFILLGFLLMIVGFIGVFFGKLIKSALSRQREYLADASAVQFTRNPDGISGALKKIGGFDGGSRIANSHAEEASHLFFGNGLKSGFTNALATHPPLPERIRRIDPSFSGKFSSSAKTSKRSAHAAAASGFAAGGTGELEVTPDEVVRSVGAPTQQHIDYAASLIASIPEKTARAAREPYGARAVIYCMLLNRESAPRSLQLKRLAEHADSAVYKETLNIMAELEKIDPQARLPLIDIALGSLRQLSPSQYKAFITNIDHLVRADEQIDLFEYTLQKMISRHLEPAFSDPRPHSVDYHDIGALSDSAAGLLSCLAHWGSDSPADAERAYDEAIKRLNITNRPSLLPPESCGLQAVDDALSVFARSSPGVKRLIINAATGCVAADGKVTVEEAELLRAVSDSLDCPMPPLLSRKKAA